MTASERRLIIKSNQTAKLVWIGLMILEGIALAIVVIGIILGASLFGNLTSNVNGAQKAVATGVYGAAASFYLLLPLLLINSTFRLDKWVRWLMWINVLLQLPSMVTSVRGFFAGLIAVLIAIGYEYILRRVYSNNAPNSTTPTAPTQGIGPATQVAATKNSSINKILIITIVVVILGFGFTAYNLYKQAPSIIKNTSGAINTALQGDANRNIANVHIPLAIDPGIFIGKLEQFDFQASDLPSEFEPYTFQRTGNGYQSDPKKLLADDKDAQQFYESALSNNLTGDKWTQGHIQVATFTTTYGSSLYYALGKQKNQSKLQTFSRIPFEHFVVKKTSSSSLEPAWFVEILDSNAIFFLYIDVPAPTSQTTIETIVQNWLKHVDAYTPGTSADVKSENASGETIGGSQ